MDVARHGNIAQSLRVTRIGEAILIRAGLNVDTARGTFGGTFSIAHLSLQFGL